MMSHDNFALAARCPEEYLLDLLEPVLGESAVLNSPSKRCIHTYNEDLRILIGRLQISGKVLTVGTIGEKGSFPEPIHWNVVVPWNRQDRRGYLIYENSCLPELEWFCALGQIARDHHQVGTSLIDES